MTRQTKKRRSQREGHAYHEAGHAVIAYMKSHKLAGVSIKGGGCVEGFTVAGYCRLSRKSKLCLHDAAEYHLAGPAAEARYWGRWRIVGMMRDVSIVSELTDGRYTDYLTGAKVLVKHYWPMIQKLAGELLKAETLSGKAAERIIDEAWRQKMYGKMPASTGSRRRVTT